MTSSKPAWTPDQVYAACLNGWRISDQDCLRGLAHFRQLADLLSLSGPEFRQAFRAANSTACTLETYLRARGVNPYPLAPPTEQGRGVQGLVTGAAAEASV